MNSPFKRKNQRGATLVEVLVALLVLSIGLLGVAALQVSALQTNRGAHVRSQASVLAYDIADRMRANRDAALADAYVLTLTAPAGGTGMALADLQNWKATLTNTLPSGQGEIARAATCSGSGCGGPTSSAPDFDTRTRI